MGLDMYLKAERYVSGWGHSDEGQRDEYFALVGMFGMNAYVEEHSPSATVSFTVAYWRKANQIHGWFVRNVQDGEDDCRGYDVGRDQLIGLRSLCNELLLEHAEGRPTCMEKVKALLPPTQGFFFGTYGVDDYYWEELRDTITMLDRVLAMPETHDTWFTYQSSW